MKNITTSKGGGFLSLIKVILADVNSPEFESAMMRIFQKGIEQYIQKVQSDPFKDYGDFMSRADVAKVLCWGTGKVINRATRIEVAKTSGKKIDYSTELIEYKDGKRNPFFKTSEVKQYYNRLNEKT